MTALPLELLRRLQAAEPSAAWNALFEHAWSVCSAAISVEKAASVVSQRDSDLAPVDLFLATAGWDLWRGYEAGAPRTADALADWWKANPAGRAVLILDALSLREVPWLLSGAAARGYKLHQARATGAELPADTTPFAEALGLASRSTLDNNGAAKKGRLQAATTESSNVPWLDCVDQLKPSPDVLFWHHWPDKKLHDLGSEGKGFEDLALEAQKQLTSDDFWKFIHDLTNGRRLIITADHGYCVSGNFPDTADANQTQYLKTNFGSSRAASLSGKDGEAGAWVPPIDLRLKTAHGESAFVLGRRKWKSSGGYPKLAHGGLSLLEVAVPFIELSRAGGK